MTIPAFAATTPRAKTRVEGVRPGWCVVHGDFAWFYSDASIGCMYDYIVEGLTEPCGAVLPVHLEIIPNRKPYQARKRKGAS